MQRALVIDDTVREKIAAHVAWANRAENWYYPERDKEPPGQSPAYTMHLAVGFRVVYSHTVAEGRHFRHLSISVTGKHYPHHCAAFTIATLFGFTGGRQVAEMTIEPGEDWMMEVNETDRCIMIAQEVREGN